LRGRGFPISTLISLDEPLSDLVDARAAIVHFPEGSPSLLTRRKANCSLNQGEELFEQAI